MTEMSEPTIRLATPDDAPALLAIYEPYVRQTAITCEYEVPSVEEFAGRIERTLKRYPYLVMELDGRPVGYAYASPLNSREAYDWSVETSIYLARDVRHGGLGRKLHDALRQCLVAMGITNMCALIAVPHDKDDEYLTHNSQDFHAHMGYRLVGAFDRCAQKFGRWYDMCWMELVLAERVPNQPKPTWFPDLPAKNHHKGDSELPPISWTSGNGRFSMSIDLRVKHDLESRRRAVELFDAGVGCKPAAEALSVPRETVREWQWVYRAFGSEALLSMGGKQSRYTFEQRVAAASAVVDGGMAKADAMAEFGIRSKSPLERWCRLYREGGAEALRPGPKGRPRGSRSKPRARTREQELEERCRRLEAEVAYLKKLRALVERDGL